MIKIAVAGPRGKMGSEAIHMINATENFELVSAIDRMNDGKLVADIQGLPAINAPVFTDIERCFSNVDVDVLIDFTHPEVGKKNLQTAFDYGIKSVIGTSGFTEDDVVYFQNLAEEKKVGSIIAPNFAIGAVLMMKFSQMAAKFLPDIEIIEMHHDQKKDAPSGTAVKTAEMIKKERTPKHQGHPDEKEIISGSRGGHLDGIHIHSVRLPGLIAHQQVLFGGNSELLTIRHDSFHRKSFMTGVKLAVETVMGLDMLVYGLENIME